MFPILLDLAEIVRKSLKVSRPSARIINVFVMGCVTSSLGCYVIVQRCHNVSLAGVGISISILSSCTGTQEPIQ